MPYSYMLRFAVQPGFHEEANIERLVDFCKEARIDDVMFFVNGEEVNIGHLTLEETVPWMEMVARAKDRLAVHGITTSLNPWPTLLHADRGRTMRKGQAFDLMVDPRGTMATAQVCPISPSWREYVAGIFAMYASIEPRMIWLDDDFRLHNHHPLEWGGCFCDLHMAEFSRRAGRELTREEFVAGVLRPGEPHPYRRIWLDFARETMVGLAEHIGDAVHRVSPATQVALMSSMPSVHCAEARDWAGVLGGLAGELPPANRPHLPAYWDKTPNDYLWGFNTVSRPSTASIPESTEIYPEIDSVPRGRFSKSNAFMRFQIETSFALCSKGITLNIFDMTGNGVMMHEGYQKTLSELKDYASRVTDLGLRPSAETGIRVLADSKSSYTIHTGPGVSMGELYTEETIWACFLSSFSIANTFAVDALPTESVVAVSGQYFRNLSREQLESLFAANYVMIDGDAISTLLDMGHGDLLGIRSATWHEQDSGFHSYEQVCDGKVYYDGLPDARIALGYVTGDFLEIEYTREPEMKTAVMNPFGERVAQGTAVQDRRVFIHPFGRYGGRYQMQLSPVRQAIWQSALADLGSRSPVFAVGAAYVGVYVYNLGDRTAVLLANFSSDPLDRIELHAPGLNIGGAVEVNKQQPTLVPACLTREGESIISTSGLASMETKVLVFSKQ